MRRTNVVVVMVLLTITWAGIEATRPCGRTFIRQLAGRCSTPDYPATRARNLDCKWYISVPLGYYIQIRFENRDLSSADTLYIYSTNSTSGTSLRLEPFSLEGKYSYRSDSPDLFLKTSEAVIRLDSGYTTTEGKLAFTFQAYIPQKCPNPGVPPNGLKVGNNYTLGSTVSFVCNSGFTLIGKDNTTCVLDQDAYGAYLWKNMVPTPFWDTQIPQCVLTRAQVRSSADGPCIIEIKEKKAGNISFFSDVVTCANDEIRYVIYGESQERVVTAFTGTFQLAHNTQLVVHDGSLITDPIIFRTTGKFNATDSIVSSGNYMLVRILRSSTSTVRSIFTLSYKVLGCGGTIENNMNGIISTPNHPNKYPPNIKCKWTIIVPSGYLVATRMGDILDFKAADYHDDTSMEYLAFFDGVSNLRLERLYKDKNYTTLSDSNKMNIWFYSFGVQETGRGFQIHYTAFKCTERFNVGSEGTGIIQSPNYPRPYQLRAQCEWVIKAPPSHRIKLQFNGSMDIRERYHRLEITDGERQTKYENVAYDPAEKYIANTVSESSTVVVKFSSTWDRNSFPPVGFQILYSVIKPNHCQPLKIPNGVLDTNSTSVGTTAKIQCRQYYTLNGSQTVQCTPDNAESGMPNWTANAWPVCEFDICNKYLVPVNSSYGFFRTPLFPAPTNAGGFPTCHVSITAPSGHRIAVRFNYFDIIYGRLNFRNKKTDRTPFVKGYFSTIPTLVISQIETLDIEVYIYTSEVLGFDAVYQIYDPSKGPPSIGDNDTCMEPTSPANGVRVDNVYNVGSTVRFKCNRTYTRLRPPTIRCLGGTPPKWNNPPPFCTDLIQCNRRITEGAGFIESPRPRDVQLLFWSQKQYPNGADCKWLFDLPVGDQVEIDFITFETYSSDYVDIYDGNTTDSRRIRRLSGRGVSSWNNPTRSTSNQLLVHFQSDLKYTMKGFRFNYIVLKASRCHDPGKVENGWRTAIRSSIEYFQGGDLISFGCHFGFKLEGSRILQCDGSTRSWNGSLPTCKNTCKRTIYLSPSRRTFIYSPHYVTGFGKTSSDPSPCFWTLVAPPGYGINIEVLLFRLFGSIFVYPKSYSQLQFTDNTGMSRRRTFNPAYCETYSRSYKRRVDMDYVLRSFTNKINVTLTFGSLSSYKARFKLRVKVVDLPENCREPPLVENGNLATTDLQVGKTVYYSCAKGYILSENVTSTCRNTSPRTWSAFNAPTCTLKTTTSQSTTVQHPIITTSTTTTTVSSTITTTSTTTTTAPITTATTSTTSSTTSIITTTSLAATTTTTQPITTKATSIRPTKIKRPETTMEHTTSTSNTQEQRSTLSAKTSTSRTEKQTDQTTTSRLANISTTPFKGTGLITSEPPVTSGVQSSYTSCLIAERTLKIVTISLKYFVVSVFVAFSIEY